MKVWNDFTKEEKEMPSTMTLAQLRNSSRYWIVSDAQLKRDLKGPPSIDDIYRLNRAGREFAAKARDYAADLARYQAWCEAKGHEPHPGSIDSEHPIARQREGMRFVKRETVKE